MHVRLTTDRVGGAGLQRNGEVMDLPREEALRLVAAGQAEALGDSETADVQRDRETMTTRGRKRARSL